MSRKRALSSSSIDPIRVRQRGRLSVELKFRYVHRRGQTGRRQTHDADVYFFLPYSFNIGPDTYNRSQFYDSLKPYLRFDTPRLTVSELLSRTSRISPLVRIERMVRDARKNGAAIDPDACIYNGKLLGCIYKSLLRDLLGGATGVTPNAPDRPVAPPDLRESFRDAREIARRFHRVVAVVQRKVKGPNAAVVQHMRMIDEHLSLLIEKYAASHLGRSVEARNAAKESYVARIIAKEITYREKAGYPTVIRGKPNAAQLEEHIYREKILKRYASEVLFFDIRRKNTGKGAEQLLYAIAAGIAMIFATGAAFLGQTAYGKLSTALFIILVLSYMAKDRMKDFFRDIFRRTIGARVFDRTARLHESRHRRTLAVVRERTSFVTESRLDPDVREFRNKGTFERSFASASSEKIFRYQKRVHLVTRAMNGIHPRIYGVADITIVDVGSFLRGLTSQSGLVASLSEHGSVELNQARRIYHLNMVIHMRSGESNAFYRYRLIVDSTGILRIEQA